jgi:hypothetical protein
MEAAAVYGGRGRAMKLHDGLRHSGESLEPNARRGLSLQPRGGRPQPPKDFQAPKWSIKLYFLTNNDKTKCSERLA